MLDITMCMNEKCPIRDSCYRATAIPEKLQSYANFEYKDNHCDYYINNEENKWQQEK